MSKIAVSVAEPVLDAEVEYRFARAPYLLLVDGATLAFDVMENPVREVEGGAGVQLARVLAGRGVDAVVGGELGPNADAALRNAGIAVHRCDPGTTAREAVARAAGERRGA